MARMKVKSNTMAKSLAQVQKKDVPQVTKGNYIPNLIRYLDWHNRNTDPIMFRKWAVKYMVDTNRTKESKIIKRATEFELKHIALLSILKCSDDNYISKEDGDKIESRITELLEKYNVKSPCKKKTDDNPTISPMARTQAIITYHIGVIEGKIDEYLNTNEQFDMKEYITQHNLAPMILKAIGSHFSKQRDELSELLRGKDDQLKEGYSHLRRIQQKRYFAFLNGIVQECATITKNTPKKPRKKTTIKAKPASTLVSKLKYKSTDNELDIKSQSPEKIVDATEVYLYDTQKRHYIYLKAEVNKTFTVTGTTIKNVDTEKSFRKTLRKPKEQLDSKRYTKKFYENLAKNVTSKPQKVTGRMNENIIILGAY